MNNDEQITMLMKYLTNLDIQVKEEDAVKAAITLLQTYGGRMKEIEDSLNRDAIFVSSIVSHRTGEGIVQIQWGGHGGQMSIDEARQMGQQFLEAAEGAETDALILRMFQRMKSNENNPTEAMRMYGMFISQLRELRDEREKENAKRRG